jgi:GAF domain-containing protein
VRAPNDPYVDDGFQAITGLSRSLVGCVDLADVGSLLWVVLRQMVPCDTMALFVPDPRRGQIVVRYVAGAHADRLIGLRRPEQAGIAGWVSMNCRSVLNAEPIFDLGYRAGFAPALRSSVAVPLVDNGTVVAVLVLYSRNLLAFTDEQAMMLELLGPRLAVTIADAASVQDDDCPADARPALRLVSAGLRA